VLAGFWQSTPRMRAQASDPHATPPYVLPREILSQFDTSGPRYTSYPTAPEWTANFPREQAVALIEANQRERAKVPLSLYVHIPFCHKLCWYCGCNMQVTRNPELVERYLEALTKEIGRVAAHVDLRREVVQIHWGGGTPTFLDPAQLERLFRALTAPFTVARGAEISIEVHPPVTTFAQLETLAALGFNRLSLGIQDFDPEVQKAVNRLQPYEQTRDLITEARRLGFRSINADLMYGLPKQTPERFARTLDLVDTLRPERLALFNYAHVPWMKPHQKLIKAEELPSVNEKVSLLELAVNTLVARGYQYVGFDHFALPDSELAVAQRERTLRRNFMGYTTCADSDVYAFGVSSISDLNGAYLQNARTLPDYLERMEHDGLPVQHGMALSADDQLRRDVINALACHGHLDTEALGRAHGVVFDDYFADALPRLEPFLKHGIVERTPGAIDVTPRGRMLLRNVCMVFDAYLGKPAGAARRYSRTL